MTYVLNELDQPVGITTKSISANYPQPKKLDGKYCLIEPIDVERHANDLFNAYAVDESGRMWTYMTYGPFEKLEAIEHWLEEARMTEDPQFYAIVDKANNKAMGLCSYMRIKPKQGSIEIGGISFSPFLQRTRVATDAMYTMAKRAFEDLGFRRYEWKCDSLNEASRKAAQRFGFEYEGTFKKHMMYHGRNRDTSWYSIVDDDWPSLSLAYEQWLRPENFDKNGHQRKRLSDFLHHKK